MSYFFVSLVLSVCIAYPIPTSWSGVGVLSIHLEASPPWAPGGLSR